MEPLTQDVLFVALARPQMLLGVTYGYAIANAVITTELFLVFSSAWVLVVALIIHAIGWIGCQRDPRIFELWTSRVRYCPRIKNHGIWGCNSYRP